MSRAKNFFLHYDFRAPEIGPPAAELYAAALEQCAWGEGVGFDEVVISSHHGCEDDYGPAPLIAATAIAARTRRIAWMFLFVTQDPDRAWARLAPHLLHVANSYARWMSEAGTTPVYTPVSDIASLQATGTFQVVTPEACLKLLEGVDDVIVDPLFGGISAALAEESLELLASRVLPVFRGGNAPGRVDR